MLKRISRLAQQTTVDPNLLTAERLDELLFSAFDQALGEETRERMRIQYDNYNYYEGKQHKDEHGNLVRAEELPMPAGLAYKPTRYATNYFKAIVDRKARWQMGGEHGISVPREQVDDPVDAADPTYEESEAQRRENERAENYEALLYQLWEENKMRARLLQAARDRLVADRVVCKIVFNSRTGKLRWVWRPDFEYVPVRSDDDFEDLIACHFLKWRKVEVKNEEVDAVQLQTYRLWNGECYLSEAVYLVEDLRLYKMLTPTRDEVRKQPNQYPRLEGRYYKSMGIDFLPIVEFPVDETLASATGDGEIAELRVQNDILNQMNEDAIDSLKFEMFPMTAVFNAPPGTAEKMRIAPGAVLEATGAGEGQSPDIKKIESGFRWKDAFKDQYTRVKAAMHEISGLPQVVPQELDFGGVNSEALQVMFHDIIADTKEHWLVWGYGLAELHEKSVRYLQARLYEPNFAYDKQVVRSITNYKSEINFVFPLPDNRKELVELLSLEMANEVESRAGAMERLGVDNVRAKKEEIKNEKLEERQIEDPYFMGGEKETREQLTPSQVANMTEKEIEENPNVWRGESGELEMTCPECGGTGQIISRKTGEQIQCPTCRGKGYVQVRKR